MIHPGDSLTHSSLSAPSLAAAATAAATVPSSFPISTDGCLRHALSRTDCPSRQLSFWRWEFRVGGAGEVRWESRVGGAGEVLGW
jgi:hypothetical protein